jgi:hypothetical protein
MGYCHYWTVPRAHRDYLAAWPMILDDTRRIIDAVRDHGVVIAGYDGWRRPTLHTEGHGIAFNRDASTDLDADPFTVTPPLPITPAHPQPLNVCKTNRKPYDVAVTAVLLRCALLLPDVFLIRSDGAWDGEWAHSAARGSGPALPSARDIVGAVFGPVPTTSPFAVQAFPLPWQGSGAPHRSVITDDMAATKPDEVAHRADDGRESL